MRCLQGTLFNNWLITTWCFLMVFQNSVIKWEWFREEVVLCGIASSVFMKLCLSSTSIKRSNQANWGKKRASSRCQCRKRQRLFLCENEMVNSHTIRRSHSLTVINCICTNCDSWKDFFRGCLGKNANRICLNVYEYYSQKH